MASWRPQTDLEHEIVSLQPNYNFIYGDLTDAQKKLNNGYHSRPPAHLEFLKVKSKKADAEDEDTYSNGLNAIRTVHRMVGLKQLGEPINVEDLDNIDNLDRETIAMIRYCGMGPTLDLPLNEKTTIPTLPLKNDVRIVQKGKQKFPVILNDDYFKVESTRMRNAKLLENVNSSTNEIKSTKVEEKLNLREISVLNEEEIKEPTDTEIAEKEYQEFLIAFPKLGTKCDRQKKSAINSSTQAKQKDREPMTRYWTSKQGQENWHSLDKNSSTSANSSLSSLSMYNSFDSTSSSTYFSANESLINDRTNRPVGNVQNKINVWKK